MHVDYYTYIESMRVVRKHTVCDKCDCSRTGSMHGDVMRSRAVIARILCVHFDLYVYVHDFP